MKLPLSEAELAEIQAAYEAALKAAKECAESFRLLSSVLHENTSCISQQAELRLQEQTTIIGASEFRMKMSRCRVKNSKLEGREFSLESAISKS